MLNSRNILMLTAPITVLVSCYLSLGVNGYTYDENDPAVYSQEQGSWRAKRMMNQISCHCCSNSFNSHCCLQCMQRVGKRSDVVIPESSSFLSDLSGDVGSDVDSLVDDGSFGGNGLMCSCCILQMHRRPYADSWPCCTECQLRSKRSAGKAASQAEGDSAKA